MLPTATEFERVLHGLGVAADSLRAEQRAALDDAGYLWLPELLDDARLAALRECLEWELATTPETAASRQGGTRHVAELPWKDAAYDVACTHPRLLAAVHHVLARPFRLLHLSARDPQAGFGLQGLHTDWLPRGRGEPDRIVTALWLLDDFTADNGATRVVPGSHRLPYPLPKPLLRPQAHHPDERLLSGVAGSVLVFNGHLYHGGTANRAGTPRRALQCQFVACDSVSPGAPCLEPPEHSSAELRLLLGVRS